MRLTESRDKMHPIGKTAVLGVVAGVVLLGLFVLQNQLWFNCFQDSVPPLDAARQIHTDLTTGFVSFIETSGSEITIDGAEVMAPFDRASEAIRQWIDAQSVPEAMWPRIDSVSVGYLGHIRDDIERFRAGVARAFPETGGGEVVPAQRQELESILVNLELMASAFDDHLGRNLTTQFLARQTGFSLVAIVWLVIGILTAAFLIQVFRKHRRIEKAARESRQMLQSVLDTIPVRVFWKDLDSNYIGCNRLFAEDAGLDNPADIGGKTDFELAWKDQAELYRADDREVVSKNESKLSYEEPQTSPDGKNLWLRTSKVPLRNLGGETIGVLGTYEEITEWKQAEKALQDSLRTSADIVAAIPSGLMILQYRPPESFELLSANPEAEFLLGIEEAKCRGREFHTIMLAAREAGLTESFVEVMNSGKTYATENLPYNDGRIDGFFRIRAFRMPGDRLGVALENITERTRAYEALRESRERYRFLYRNMPVIMQTIDSKGHLTDVSRQWVDKLGFERNEVLDRKLTDFMTRESSRLMNKFILPQVLKTGTCRDRQVQLVKKNGEILEGLLSFVAQNDETDAPAVCHGILIDITDLKQTERRTHKFFRAVEQSPGIVIITDPQGLIEYVNPRFTEVTGYTFAEVHGQDLYNLSSEFRHPEVYEKIKDSLRSGKNWTGNIQRRRKNGEPYWERFSISPIVDSSGRTVNCLAIGQDITNEITMFRKLADSEKTNAIGILAAGVAHEFKNYLCGIIGNASHSLENLDDSAASSRLRNAFATIIDIAGQADNVATSLLTYSRASSDIFQPEDLRDIIERTLQLIRKEMEVLSINLLTYYDDIPKVVISSGKIQQLLLNLLTNARQAVISDGFIMVSILNDENCVRIRVADTGGGIATDIIDRIYDPFFSTKGVWGRDYDIGTGMGLATCRNIALEHGGDLNVDAIHGAGAVFTLSLPISKVPSGAACSVWTPPLMPRIILAGADRSTVEFYFNQAHASRYLLYPVRALSQISPEDREEADLVIIDAAAHAVPGAADFGSSPGEIGANCIIVNGHHWSENDMKAGPGKPAVYTDRPELANILKSPGRTVPQR